MRLYRDTPEGEKPRAVIVDMDGTLVDVSSIRHYVTKARQPDGTYNTKNFDAFHKESVKCPAIWSTVDKVMWYWESGYDILIVTARGAKYYDSTAWWLNSYAIPHTAVMMRDEGDYRADYEVKKDILKRIRYTWHVSHAIDDNPNVIKLWEEEGIPVTVVPGWEDEIA